MLSHDAGDFVGVAGGEAGGQVDDGVQSDRGPGEPAAGDVEDVGSEVLDPADALARSEGFEADVNVQHGWWSESFDPDRAEGVGQLGS